MEIPSFSKSILRLDIIDSKSSLLTILMGWKYDLIVFGY